MAKRILIVDDEPDICEILRFNLEMEDYEVMTAEGADEAQQLVNRCLSVGRQVDLILLDVMMTPKSGFEWAKELKSNYFTANIPIIFCTAKTLEDDLLTGFALGSDDYICKPFRISEVKARVKAVLRRSGASDLARKAGTSIPHHPGHGTEAADAAAGGVANVEPTPGERRNVLVFSSHPESGRAGEGLLLDLDRKECFVDGSEVSFTKLEFEVLALLLSKPGQVFSREKILHTVWPSDAIVLDRTVDVNITRIRKKIGQYGEFLRTKFGYGYMFSR